MNQFWTLISRKVINTNINHMAEVGNDMYTDHNIEKYNYQCVQSGKKEVWVAHLFGLLDKEIPIFQ